MSRSTYKPRLDRRKRYLQVAFNSTLNDAQRIIAQLPVSDRIIVEAGTPLIKRYGVQAITRLRSWLDARFAGVPSIAASSAAGLFGEIFFAGLGLPTAPKIAPRPTGSRSTEKTAPPVPYVVADMKTMDRGETEVEMVASAGASAAIALGSAPTETLNTFVASCEAHGIDAMIDMMNVPYPLAVLRALKKIPPVVILHRGVDEERENREKQIPFYEIQRIKGNYDIMISIAGGDTGREVQRAVFNDADIVVIWKSVYAQTKETIELVNGFLKDIR